MSRNNASEGANNLGFPPGFPLGVSDFSTSEPLFNAEAIIASGMDFIEPGLAKIAAMTDVEFDVAADHIQQNNIRVMSVNWFLPSDLKVVGPSSDEVRSRQFLEHALTRAVRLGAKAVVFGSPGSRSIPDGFSRLEAREQLIKFCQLCADVIQANGWTLRIAVEHVNHTETNLINRFSEALAIVREADRPEIGLAADFYHFAIEDEPLDAMLEAKDLICAVQLADPNGRCFPKHGTEIPGLKKFFENLTTIGYQGGVSVEATVGDDLESDCREAAAALRSLFT